MAKSKTQHSITHPSDQRFSLSIECVVFAYDNTDGTLKTYLYQEENKEWLWPKGRLQTAEDLKKAAARIVREKTGKDASIIEQLQSFVTTEAVAPTVRVVFYAVANIKKQTAKQWQPIEQAYKLFTKDKEIFNSCHQALKYALKEGSVTFSLLPKKFMLQDLQDLYEQLLKTEFDRRNFRRKLRSYDILRQLPESQTAVSHRPATYYTLDKKKYNKLLANGHVFRMA